MPVNTRIPLLSIAAAAAVLAGCKREAPPPAANVVRIHAADYAFTAPDTIPAGLTTIQLTNAGPSLHHVQLVMLDSGKTFADLMAALRNPGMPPRWVVLVPGPNPPGPGDTASVTLSLAAGHYGLLCVIPDSAGVPHFAHGMARPLEVTAATGPAAAEPVADATISLTDFAFTESAPLTAGTHIIKVTNDAQQPHELVFVRLDSGATALGLAEWAEHQHGPPPRGAVVQGGLSGMMPGAHAFVRVTLRPGTYGLICFFPDARDGKAHYAHGMTKEFRVS